MRTIRFEVTDAEQKVIEHYCADPQEWVENACDHLIAQAKDKLVEAELERMINDPTVASMTTDREEIVRNYNGPLKGNPGA